MASKKKALAAAEAAADAEFIEEDPAPAPKAAKAKKAPKFDGGEIVTGIWHNGRAYNPGDEAAFAATKPNKASLDMLAAKGVIRGFGAEGEEE